jgi:hypothetical protein
MTNDEKGYMIMRLMPDAKFTGCWYDWSVKWLDERPMPTQEEINQEYINWQAEEAKKACIEAATASYEAIIAAGYTHTDGHTYYCNEKGVMDFCMALMLNDNDPDEPVLVLDITGVIVEMTIVEFQALAVAVGRYHYLKRQEYWAALAACEF